MNVLTKDGLTGNSGFGVLNMPFATHVSASYAATKKKCFVASRNTDWRRMTLARAKKERREIISCSYCRRPAISLDHFWPYHSEVNHCAWHRNWTELIKEDHV